MAHGSEREQGSPALSKHAVIASIHEVLRHTMRVPHLEAFSANAKLNEELYLDSVMILQLIVHLELDHGFSIPDEALLGREFATVDALAEFLMGLPRSAPAAGTRGPT